MITLLCCLNGLLEETIEKQITIWADIEAVWGRKDAWTEERRLDVTYPGWTGTQSSVHISRALPRDSQIISLPWHGTSSTGPGWLMEHDTASACVHAAERPGPPAISTSCTRRDLRAVLAACFVNMLHVSEKSPCMFRGGCGLLNLSLSPGFVGLCFTFNPSAGSCEDHLNLIPDAFSLLGNCWKSIFFSFAVSLNSLLLLL